MHWLFVFGRFGDELHQRFQVEGRARFDWREWNVAVPVLTAKVDDVVARSSSLRGKPCDVSLQCETRGNIGPSRAWHQARSLSPVSDRIRSDSRFVVAVDAGEYQVWRRGMV